VTRFGAVVRADSVGHLTDAGWESLLGYGVRTIVDLRLESERREDPPHPSTVEIVHLPLGDEQGSRERAAFDSFARQTADVTRVYNQLYVGMLERFAPGIAAAVSTIGRAQDGCVLIHCFAGKDRTGIVAALTLRLAGVGLDDIAADYGLSGANIVPLLDPWIADAASADERELRRRIGASPEEAMRDVLAELERRHGSVRGYLRGAGADEIDLSRAQARLLG
jgi:protein tyrosine/serine phosphatase